jgi:hypothetical protein
MEKVSPPGRMIRWDAGRMRLTERDGSALLWIAEQYTIRLDQLQRLLGREEEEPLSLGGTNKVVARWRKAGWIELQRLQGMKPTWIWLTRKGLETIVVPYSYRNMEKSLSELPHLHAINEVRLFWEEEASWVSERRLYQSVQREKGQDLLHRPDGELHFSDGQVIAIEVERSQKRVADLSENLMELVRGQGYLSLKVEHGAAQAKQMSEGKASQYDEIWYFGEEPVRRQVMREREKLLKQGGLSLEEASRIVVRWYPLSSEEEQEQELREDQEALEEHYPKRAQRRKKR